MKVTAGQPGHLEVCDLLSWQEGHDQYSLRDQAWDGAGDPQVLQVLQHIRMVLVELSGDQCTACAPA